MDLGPRLHYLLMRSLAAFSTSALWVGRCRAVSPTALVTLWASSPTHGCSHLDLNPTSCLASPGQVPAGEDPSGDIPPSPPTVFAASCFRGSSLSFRLRRSGACTLSLAATLPEDVDHPESPEVFGSKLEACLPCGRGCLLWG